jgi:ribA/ribD-fused uncharacterized protein
MINVFDGEFAFLSNFYPSPITDEHGITYPTVEHYFQAQKTLNIAERVAIADAETPGRAKRMGRNVALRHDWETIKIDVMRQGLEMKFQNANLRARLLKTGSMPLVEGNTWHDNTWGDCQCGKCINTPGRNILGKLLMDLRERVRA